MNDWMNVWMSDWLTDWQSALNKPMIGCALLHLTCCRCTFQIYFLQERNEMQTTSKKKTRRERKNKLNFENGWQWVCKDKCLSVFVTHYLLVHLQFMQPTQTSCHTTPVLCQLAALQSDSFSLCIWFLLLLLLFLVLVLLLLFFCLCST